MDTCIEKEYALKIGEVGIKEIGFLKNLDEVKTKKGGKLCLGLECLDRDLWDFDRAFPLIKKTGVHRVRIQSGWQKTEKEKGVYDFKWLDDIVDKLLMAEIEPFLSLSYGNKIYCSNFEKCPNIENGGVGHIPIETEEEREGWKNYIRATIEHFKDRITYYEIWNEPDCSVFCCTDMEWNYAYFELIKITAPIIREIMPSAKIISCTAGFGSTDWVLRVGVGDYVDIHSFHGYTFTPELSSGKDQTNRFSYYKKHAPHLKLWRGEAGCPSYNDPQSTGALSEIKASEIKQAKFLLRHLLCDLENDTIELTSYFHAYDFKHFSGKVRYHYGLITHEELSKKPSYNCFQVLTHLFDSEVKECKDYSASFVWLNKYDPYEYEISNEMLGLLKFSAFEKNGEIFYSYYLPVAIDDETVVYKILLSIPRIEGKMENPVILDPLTRKIYPVSDPCGFKAPLTDYPMFIVDKGMIENISKITRIEEKKEFIQKMEQRDHE